MATLQELRKRRFRTIKAFAEAYGCGAQKASGILRGLYHMALTKADVKYLSSLLGVSFAECADACDNTFAELKGYRKDGWQQSPRTHKGIWERWRWEEACINVGRSAAASGDWREFRRKYGYQQEQQTTHRQSYVPECYSLLGIMPGATRIQIMQAFRDKVRIASDGKGGYVGDMHKLVLAKEQALARCK